MQTTFSKILVAASVLALVSCKEWHAQINTEVSRDGSCVRTVTTSGDDYIIMDPVWDYEYICVPKDSTNEGNYVYVKPVGSDEPARRELDSIRTYILSARFERVEDMSAHPALQICGQPVTSETALSKRFKWFYTDYTFTEIFAGWQDNFNIPLTDYVTADEASFWFTGYPELTRGWTGKEIADFTSELQEKIEAWSLAMVWDIYFNTIAHFYDDLKNPPVDRETFLASRDTVIKMAFDRDVQFFDDDRDDLLEEYFKSDAFSKIDLNEDKYDLYSNTLYYRSLGMTILKVDYTLRMPGRVTDTGRGTVGDDGSLMYRFDGGFISPGDYTITATSRCVNVWAFLLSGLVLVIAVGSFFIKR